MICDFTDVGIRSTLISYVGITRPNAQFVGFLRHSVDLGELFEHFLVLINLPPPFIYTIVDVEVVLMRLSVGHGALVEG